MRLTDDQTQIIRRLASQIAGSQSRVRVFGKGMGFLVAPALCRNDSALCRNASLNVGVTTLTKILSFRTALREESHPAAWGDIRFGVQRLAKGWDSSSRQRSVGMTALYVGMTALYVGIHH